MTEVLSTLDFDKWLEQLSLAGKMKVLARITNMQQGNCGDCEQVGGGVTESRIHWGPGLRIYFVERGGAFLILIGGGDKSSQKEDIVRAHAIAPTVMA